MDETNGRKKTIVRSKVSDPLAIENIEDSLFIHRFGKTHPSLIHDPFAYSIVMNKFNTVPYHVSFCRWNKIVVSLIHFNFCSVY